MHKCKDNLVFAEWHYFRCTICGRTYEKLDNKLKPVSKRMLTEQFNKNMEFDIAFELN